MSIIYTKAEALDILVQGTPQESLERIQKERVDRKYYLVTAYTPYAGEEMDAYLSCCTDNDLHAFCDELTADCAAEWEEQHLESWDEDGYDSREEAEEDYYAGCGTRVREIPKEEYAEQTDAYWIMAPIKE